MICVTGAEPSLAHVEARVTALPAAPLHEVRLDLLESIPEPLRLPSCPGLIVTLRDRSEGGRFHGSPEERARLLGAALAGGARYVDLEASAPDAVWRELAAHHGPERLVASAHHWGQAPVDRASLAPLLERLAARPAGVLKLAVAVTDVCELEALRGLAAADGRPIVRIGMGLAGQAGRVAYRAMGSPWSYARAPGTSPTAPGQIGWTALAPFGEGGLTPRLLALVGGRQIESSPGPRVYNRLAREEGVPFVYVAAPTADPVRALGLLAELGLAGASVTMPHKTAVLEVTEPLGFAARVGAVNTLVPRGALHRSGGRDGQEASPAQAADSARPWLGHNTDGEGVVGALAGALEGGARRVVVLGTGGAARAAAHALALAGHEVTVLGRRPEAARELAAELGERGQGEALSVFGGLSPQVVVNATSAGVGGGAPPVHLGRSWAGITVLDMVMSPPETVLLAKVVERGGRAVRGLAMWVHQGAAQWRLFTGQPVSPDRLLALAEEEERREETER